MKTNIFGDPVDEGGGGVNAFGDPIEGHAPSAVQALTPAGFEPDFSAVKREGELRTQGMQMNAGNDQLLTALATSLHNAFTPYVPTPAEIAQKERETAAGVEPIPWDARLGANVHTGLSRFALGLGKVIPSLSATALDVTGRGDSPEATAMKQILEDLQAKETDISMRDRATGLTSFGDTVMQTLPKAAAELPLYILPASAWAKTPKAAAAISGAVGGLYGALQQQGESIGRGQRPLEALPFSLRSGGIDATSTMLFGPTGIEGIFAKEGGEGVVRALIKAGVMEGGEEMVAESGQMLNEAFSGKGTPTMQDVLSRLGVAGVTGTALGSGMTGLQKAAQGVNERMATIDENYRMNQAITESAIENALQATFPQRNQFGDPVIGPVQPDPLLPKTNLGGEANGQSQKVETQGQEVLKGTEPVVTPPVVEKTPGAAFDPGHESIAKVLNLKPEAGFDVPGLPKQWGFSPIGTKEVGTFYVPPGSTLPQVQAAWEAKKAAFEAGKPVVPPVVAPTSPPAAIVPPVEPSPSPASTSLPVDENIVNVQHGLKNIAQLIKHPNLTVEQRAALQAEGDAVFQDYLDRGDFEGTETRIEALKQKVVAMSKAAPKVVTPVTTPSPVETKRPEWVVMLESMVRMGTANEAHKERLAKWYTANKVTPEKQAVSSMLRAPEKHTTLESNMAKRKVQAAELGLTHGGSPIVGLETLAKSDKPVEATLSNFLLENFKPALATTKVDLTSDSGAKYLPSSHTLKGLITHGGNSVPGLLLHESAHAATHWAITKGVTPEARKAKVELEKLLKLSKGKLTAARKKAITNDAALRQFNYAHTNVDEFIAGLFDNQLFRDHLNEIKVENQTLLDKVVELLTQALGIDPGSALAASFDALIKGNKGNEEALTQINKAREAAGVSTKINPNRIKTATKKKSPTFDADKAAAEEELAGDPWTGQGEDPLPFRFKSYAEEKTDATTPQGMGKIKYLNRLFDPRSYKTTPEERVILTNAISKHKADSGVALWLEKMKTAKRAFSVDENGQITLADGSKGFMADVIQAEIETPGSQPLTPDQTAFIATWKALNEEGIRYAHENNVKFFTDEDGNVTKIDDPHFPRTRVGTVGEELPHKALGTGQKPGSNQGPFKQRYYATEAAGRKAGVQYESDEYNRMAEWLRAVYRSVADARLVNDSALKGRLGVRLVPTGVANPMGGPSYMLVGKGPGYGEGKVGGVPALEHRVFPAETARKLQEFFNQGTPNALRVAVWANNLMKAVKFTMDVSAPFNQGLPMLFMRPGRWLKATTLSYQALFKDATLSKYLNRSENKEVSREMVENGSSLGRLQDFLAGGEKGQTAEKIPVAGKVIHASARSMGAFLTIAKVEMYKALKPLVKGDKTKLVALTESVDNMVFSGRMEQIGLTQGRALVERLVINAPSYLRAFGNLTLGMLTGGVSTQVGVRAIGSLITGVAMTMFAAYKAQGLSDDEIKERFDPRSGKFMRITMPVGDGKSIEVGFGQAAISMIRLIGDIVEVGQGKKLGTGTKNPIVRWLNYRKSPIADLVVQTLITGKDYQGNDIGALEALGRAGVPIPAEPVVSRLFKGEGSTKTALAETGAQFFGLSAFTKERPSMEEFSRQKMGKALKDLTLAERHELKTEFDTKFKPSMKEQERAAKGAMENMYERQVALTEALPSDVQDFLAKNKIELPPAQTGFEIVSKKIPLSKDETAQHQAFMVEEYTASLETLMKSPKLAEFEKDGTLQRRVNNILKSANNRARLRIKQQVAR